MPVLQPGHGVCNRVTQSPADLPKFSTCPRDNSACSDACCAALQRFSCREKNPTLSMLAAGFRINLPPSSFIPPLPRSAQKSYVREVHSLIRPRLAVYAAQTVGLSRGGDTICRRLLHSCEDHHALGWSYTRLRSKDTALTATGTSSRNSSRTTMAGNVFDTSAFPLIVIPATSAHTATIVWLHGLGDTGEGWSNIVDSMKLPHIKWIFPTAPIQPVTVNGGYPGHSWFDIRGLSIDAPSDVEGLDLAAAHVGKLLSAEQQGAGGSCVRLGVVGFSQGGALSLYTASRKAAGTLSNGTKTTMIPDLDAAVCLSGWLPNARNLKPPSDASLPILICHGTNDMVVSSGFGRKSAEALQALGFGKTEFREYKGVAHEAGQKEMVEVREWLLKQLPP